MPRLEQTYRSALDYHVIRYAGLRPSVLNNVGWYKLQVLFLFYLVGVNEMPNSKALELLIGQAMLGQAMLGEISCSLMEAYIEWDITTRNWEIVLKYAESEANSGEMFDDILSEFYVDFDNMKSAGLLNYVDTFSSRMELSNILANIEPFREGDKILRGYSYRKRI